MNNVGREDRRAGIMASLLPKLRYRSLLLSVAGCVLGKLGVFHRTIEYDEIGQLSQGVAYDGDLLVLLKSRNARSRQLLACKCTRGGER
jgi:hypothetical protein